MSKSILALLVVMSCLFGFFAAVEGYDPAYSLTAVAGSTPDIDGTIVTGEWDDASAVLFNNTAAFVKQDGENLYIAFNVLDRTREPDDYVEVGIDVLNDGGNISRDDDFVLMMKSSGYLVEFHNVTQVTAVGWTAKSNHTDDYWQAELNITYAKLQITSGEPKVLGLVFMVVDNSTISGLWPPMEFGEAYPSNWGDLISEENWIPEFSPWLFLPLSVMATLTVIMSARATNPINIGVGVLAALIYAFLGYAAQKDSFDWKKFLRTFTISIASALGLDLAGLTPDVYTALVGPVAITVWLQKLIDTAKPQTPASPNQAV